jgi:hypothetical protein
MTTCAKRKGGQAVIMVTLAMIAMCGVMGLAVDLGWSYFVKKNAQAAADAAALAAVHAAQTAATAGGLQPPFTCGGTINCTGPVSCPSPAVSSWNGNLNSACVYAGLNGFPQGGNINVVVEANITSPAPAPLNSQCASSACTVATDYWVRVRVNQQVPQLFSAVLRNTTGLVSARATAALTNVIFNASLILLNRENDSNPTMGTGVDLIMHGGDNVQAPGGMIVSSALAATRKQDNAAAMLNGTANVSNTPFTDFRGPVPTQSGGPYSCMGNAGNPCDITQPTSGDWTNTPRHVADSGSTYDDPTVCPLCKTITQPPIYTTPTNKCPVLNGNLTTANVPASCVSGGTNFVPGFYYAAASLPTQANPNPAATGAQLTISSSSTTFGDGSSFGEFIIFGGMTTSAGNQTITFSAGQYVFAGVCPTCTGGGNTLFSIDNGTTIKDATGVASQSSQTDGGEIFIFTNSNYSWASASNDTTSWSSGSLSSMLPAGVSASTYASYGQGGFFYKGGNNPNTSVTLSGLDPNSGSAVPGQLSNWEPFLWWQDRANSHVAYTPNDGIQITSTPQLPCSPELGSGTTPSLNNPCTNPNVSATSTSPQMNLAATPNTHMNGYIYQPRGGWMTLQGSGNITGPLRLITGALQTGGGDKVLLTGLSSPITVTETALIE